MISWQITITMFIVLTVTFAVVKPYKSEVANNSGVCFCAIFAVYGAISLNFDTATAHEQNSVIIATIVLLNLPHIVFYGYVVYRVGKLLKQCDINFKTALKVLCFRELRDQNEGAALLNHP